MSFISLQLFSVDVLLYDPIFSVDVGGCFAWEGFISKLIVNGGQTVIVLGIDIASVRYL